MNQLSTGRTRRGIPLIIRYIVVCIIAIVLITGSIRYIINSDSQNEVEVEIANMYDIAEIQIAAQYNTIVGDALNAEAMTMSYVDENGELTAINRKRLIRLYESIIDNTGKYAAIVFIRSGEDPVYAGAPKETEVSDFMLGKYESDNAESIMYAFISRFYHSDRVKEATFTVTIPMQNSSGEVLGYIMLEPYLEVIIKDVERALANANIYYELISVEANEVTYVYSEIDKKRGTDSAKVDAIYGAAIAKEIVDNADANDSFSSSDGQSYYHSFEMPVSNFYGEKHNYISPGRYVFVLTLPAEYYSEITNMEPNLFILLTASVSLLSIMVMVLLYVAQNNRRKFTAKTTKMAQVDNLTGLLNRAYFTELFENMVNDNPEAKYAILFMDLDGFKDINDSYGHNMGDKVLRVVANRLVMAARREDLVSRFGGDEFAMLINYNSIDQVRYVANKVVRAIDEVMVIEENEYHVGVSVGVAIYPDHARTVDDLYTVADNAMYKVKYSTKNAYYISKGDDKVMY